jgi:hypothetical protein
MARLHGRCTDRIYARWLSLSPPAGNSTISMTPNGQATMQDLQPMHFSSSTCTLSFIWRMASFGQLRAQGRFHNGDMLLRYVFARASSR